VIGCFSIKTWEFLGFLKRLQIVGTCYAAKLGKLPVISRLTIHTSNSNELLSQVIILSRNLLEVSRAKVLPEGANMKPPQGTSFVEAYSVSK